MLHPTVWKGAFTILSTPTTGPRCGNPPQLPAGYRPGRERTSSADVSAFIDYTKGSRRNGSGSDDNITGTDYPSSTSKVTRRGQALPHEWDAAAAEKGGFNSFMEKEIHEQPPQLSRPRAASTRTVTLPRRTNIDDSVLRSIDKIIVVACGTAYAGQVARYAIEHWCRIPTEVELATSSATATPS